MYAAFPSDLLKTKCLAVVRVDFHGKVHVEFIAGELYDRRSGRTIWVLVYQGHMRLLLPPQEEGGSYPQPGAFAAAEEPQQQ